jgi:DHA1 family purine base/nucleoside efflux pump-like MFS transporter
VAHLASWRVALLSIAVAAAVVAVAVSLLVRGLPNGERPSLSSSASLLIRPRLLLLIASNLWAVVAFNVVYVFSSVVAATVISGDGPRLGMLLAVCGFGALVGSVVSGPLSDSLGSTASGLAALLVLVTSVTGLTVQHSSAVVLVSFFGVGAAAQAFVVPQQHRLFEVSPRLALVTSSWNSTALYGGIALAPVLGGLVIARGPVVLIALGGAAAVAALILFAAAAWGPAQPVAEAA